MCAAQHACSATCIEVLLDSVEEALAEAAAGHSLTTASRCLAKTLIALHDEILPCHKTE